MDLHSSEQLQNKSLVETNKIKWFYAWNKKQQLSEVLFGGEVERSKQGKSPNKTMLSCCSVVYETVAEQISFETEKKSWLIIQWKVKTEFEIHLTTVGVIIFCLKVGNLIFYLTN